LAKELGLKVLKRVNDERGFNDVYLTGEKILYTVEFAKLYDLNLVVGSHTFTELLGVKSMLEKSELGLIEIVRIDEEHIEVSGFER